MRKPKDPRPHRTAMERAAANAVAYRDIRTWYGAVWALRNIEQKATDLKRAEYVTRYRPIQTLDGLDPSPARVAIREIDAALRALGRAMRG